jgi:hypothetical protein
MTSPTVCIKQQQQQLVPSLSTENLIVRNLQAAVFKLSVEPTNDEVLSIASYQQLLFVSVAQHGLNIYRIDGNAVIYIDQVGGLGTTCYSLTTTNKNLAYMMEEENSQRSIFVHKMMSFVENGITEPGRSLVIQQAAPFTVLSTLGLLIIGGAAWTASWTSDTIQNTQLTGVNECHVVVLDLDTFQVLTHWKAIDHSVSQLQCQTYNAGCMLGVTDSRSGINVYSLGRSNPSTCVVSFTHLYHVDVDEIRNFQLVGPCVAVFHRFEPNISFWNILEQRTILCINVQDQTRKLSEEFTDINTTNTDDTDECSLIIDDDDYVTSVTSLPTDNGSDYLLVYGTVSGCVFGMSVQRRTKLFSVPCPHSDVQKAAVQSISFLPTGQLITAYQGRTDLTLMNFGADNPPDRPPTRSHKQPKCD